MKQPMSFDLCVSTAARALADPGFFILDHALLETDYQLLQSECLQALSSSARPAKISEGSEAGVRENEIVWIGEDHPAGEAFLNALMRVAATLAPELFISIQSVEGHFAHYGPGAFYKTHSDNPEGRGNRLLTAVFYFNDNWQAGDGGELRIEGADALIAPLGNRLVIFDSRIAHEVLVSHSNRTSIAAWLRRDTPMALPKLAL